MNIIYDNIDDILDVKGKYNNFLNDNPFSENYFKLADKWSKLPLYTDKKSIKNFLTLLDTNQVILLSSGTGSGKTVIIPKLVLKYFITMKIPGKVAITNPKIITTLYNAKYGAETLDVNLGDEVGYKYKGASKNSSSDLTKLLYLTDGLLLATIFNGDKYLSEYAGVIIDEAHERHVQIDILLKLLKEIVLVRKDFKLIIMSATINAEVFKNYFNIDGINYGEIEVSTKSNYPIEQIWLDKDIKTNTYLEVAVEKCKSIIKNKKDIIIFVPTQNDTINGCKSLNSLKDNSICISFYSKMDKDDLELAKDKDLYKEKGHDVKIIFSTNVAESSITFDGLVYVIDTGLELTNHYDAINNSYVVAKIYTSQSQIIQRIGRTGRTFPGIAYHLYTKEKFNQLIKYPEPNILMIDLTEQILSLINYAKTIKIFNKQINDFITIPKKEQITNALHKLHFNNCIKLVDFNSSYDDINNYNGALTLIGLSILKFKSSLLLTALAIIMAKYLKCQFEIIIIMAIIEITDGQLNSLFVYKNVSDLKVFKKYSVNNSDHLTILNIYQQYYKLGNNKHLNISVWLKIKKRIQQLLFYSKSINKQDYKKMNKKYKLIEIKPYADIIDNIIYILYKSHRYNLIHNNTTINYLNNSTANLEYSKITSNIKMKNSYHICHLLVNRFGQKVFTCISNIPNKFIL